MAPAACAISGRDIWSLGSWSWSWCGIEFSGGEKFVECASVVYVGLRPREQVFCSARFGFFEHLEPLFELEVIRDFHAGCGRIELEWIFAQPEPLGIVTIQQPL